MHTPVSHHLLLHPFSVAALCPSVCLHSDFGSLWTTSQIVSFPCLPPWAPLESPSFQMRLFLENCHSSPKLQSIQPAQSSSEVAAPHVLFKGKNDLIMAKMWETIPSHNQGLQSSHQSVAQRHRGNELSNFVRFISSRRSMADIIGRFRKGGERLKLRPGHSRWFHSISLLLNSGMAPLFPRRDAIPLSSRSKQMASVNTGTRCSVWPGEITEMLHIRQLELLQMCDCSAADWKNAQFHNKVSQKCRAFGKFYPAVACSRDSILWWLGAEPPCVSGLVFILCGLHIHKCTQMEEDLLSFPTWQL